ncbi:MAG: DUF5518 domain-containing protein [Candidatus Thorarchaeota archaeon]
MTITIPQTNSVDKWRFYSMVLAVILLNIGLYFILAVFAPLVSGLICGYFLKSKTKGAIGGFLGGLLAFIPMELISAQATFEFYVSEGLYTVAEIQANLPFLYAMLIVAAIILASFGTIGGYIGGILGKRTMTQTF